VDQAKPESIDAYIAASPPEKRAVLERIRETARVAAPDAKEVISYRMPTLMQNGVLVHFAAFKNHIGLYPPIRGDVSLEEAIAPYVGEKGNLRFPLDQPIPYDLIERIVKFKVAQNASKAASKGKRGRGSGSGGSGATGSVIGR
jgi:uncharacterized protein YdhG (YjbR/CyaY superfamily)